MRGKSSNTKKCRTRARHQQKTSRFSAEVCCSFDVSAGFRVFPYTFAPSAQKRKHIRTVVILAEDLKRLVGRRAPLVNEIVNALLPGYQFRPLPQLGDTA
jgi:hypothetical protein